MKLKLYRLIGQKIRPMELGLLMKKIFRIKRQEFHFQGHDFYVDPVSNFGIRLMQDGEYEDINTRTIKDILSPGDTFIDLGTNEGYFSVIASGIVGTSGKVISIEPQQRLWPVIAKNALLNDCLNLQLIPFAVGEEETEIEIILTPSTNTGSSTLIANKRNSLWGRQKSKTIRLDKLVQTLGIPSIKLIKIDIEGFEYFALKSAESLLREGIISNLLVEFHPPMLKEFNTTEEEIVEYLSNLGYKRSELNPELFTRLKL